MLLTLVPGRKQTAGEWVLKDANLELLDSIWRQEGTSGAHNVKHARLNPTNESTLEV